MSLNQTPGESFLTKRISLLILISRTSFLSRLARCMQTLFIFGCYAHVCMNKVAFKSYPKEGWHCEDKRSPSLISHGWRVFRILPFRALLIRIRSLVWKLANGFRS